MASYTCVRTAPPASLSSPFAPSTSACQPDSDCGSSSGLGGMKAQERASDEGASSSSSHPTPLTNSTHPSPMHHYSYLPSCMLQPAPSMHHPHMQPHHTGPPPQPQAALQGLPPMHPQPFLAPGVPPPLGAILPPHGPLTMPWNPGMPPDGTHDLFVHVQSGETLAMVVGNEIQHVTGPATVRMVGDGSMPPTALPICVPTGHQIHQIVDETGCLRHVILSVESPPNSHQSPNTLREIPVLNAENSHVQSVNTRYVPLGPPMGPPIGVNMGMMAAPAPPLMAQAIGPPGPQAHGAITPPTSQPLGQPMPPPMPPPMAGVIQPGHAIQPITQAMIQSMALPRGEVSVFHAYPQPNYPTVANEYQSRNGREDEGDPDPEEKEKVLEMLNRALSPQIIRIASNDVDVQWQLIDTSEAAAPGGPFPQIDNSEFVYHVVLFESSGRFVAAYRYDAPEGNQMRLCHLRPNTDYFVQLKVSLDERGLMGQPSQPVFFKSAPGRPEPPLQPRLIAKGTDFIHFSWKPAFDNGAIIHCYFVYMALNEESPKVYQFTALEGRVGGLMPSSSYRITVTSANALGESVESAPLHVLTKSNKAPTAPIAPSVMSVTHRSIRLTWPVNNDCLYSLEMFDVSKNVSYILRERLTGSTLTVPDLTPCSEYRFRLFTRSADGESPRSDWMVVRTSATRPYHEHNYRHHNNSHHNNNNNHINHHHHNNLGALNNNNSFNNGSAIGALGGVNINHVNNNNNGGTNVGGATNNGERREEKTSENLRVPCRPYILAVARKKIEVAWKCTRDRDLSFHLEGSTYRKPAEYYTIYRGPSTSYQLLDEQVKNLRVQSITRRGVASEFSDVLSLLRSEEDPFIPKPSQLTTPTLASLPNACVQIDWEPLKDVARTRCGVIYEVSLVCGGEQPVIVYSGRELQCFVENIAGRQTVHIQVRAVFVFDQKTYEGDWSTPATITTTRAGPPNPINLQYDVENGLILWECKEHGEDVRFRVDITPKIEDKQETLSFSTTEHRLRLPKLMPATMHFCVVTAMQDGEMAEYSKGFEFETPASTPSSPYSMSIESGSTDSLLLHWMPADCRGSPIIHYRLKVLDEDSKIVREVAIPPEDDEDVCEYSISQLEPNTQYQIEFCAENELGMGPAVTMSGRTKCLPPVAPTLTCEPDFNCMRLRWKPVSTQSSIAYKLVRINEKDQQVFIYEGENLTAKVSKLVEDTEYTFKIRAFNKLSGESVWSEPVKFRTKIAPPPLVRLAPVSTPVANQPDNYNVEWSNLLPKPNTRNQFYRLQAVDSDNITSRWRTIYEGVQPSFVINMTAYTGPVQLRVFCVRPGDDGEVMSAASPVAFITHEPREPEIKPVRSHAAAIKRRLKAFCEFMGRNFIAFVVITFAVLSFSLALFCDQMFDLATLSMSTPSTSPSPSMHRQPIVSLTPPSPPPSPRGAVYYPLGSFREF